MFLAVETEPGHVLGSADRLFDPLRRAVDGLSIAGKRRLLYSQNRLNRQISNRNRQIVEQSPYRLVSRPHAWGVQLLPLPPRRFQAFQLFQSFQVESSTRPKLNLLYRNHRRSNKGTKNRPFKSSRVQTFNDRFGRVYSTRISRALGGVTNSDEARVRPCYVSLRRGQKNRLSRRM